MREHIAADEEFQREDIAVADALERFRDEGQDYKVELIEDLVAQRGRRDRLALHERAVHRPLPRPARSRHQADQGVQAAVGRRRLLARGLQAADADPRLRHRVLLEGRPRGAPRTARARHARTITAGSAPSSACSASQRSRRAPPSGCPPAPRSSTSSSTLSREMGRERGYVEVKTPQIYDSSLWKTSGHWDKYDQNMFVTEYEERADGGQADELPRPLQALLDDAPLLP